MILWIGRFQKWCSDLVKFVNIGNLIDDKVWKLIHSIPKHSGLGRWSLFPKSKHSQSFSTRFPSISPTPWRSHRFPQEIHQKLLDPAKHPPKNPPKISASARAQHPHTASPGLRSDETWDLSQLRCWEATWMDGWRWDILRYENKVVRKIIPKILGYVLLFQGWTFFDVVVFKMFVWSSIFCREVCTFFGWCWNFLQFFFKGVWVSESKSNFLLGMPGMPSFGDPKFGDPYFPSKKRSPLPSLTAKLLLPWS